METGKMRGFRAMPPAVLSIGWRSPSSFFVGFLLCDTRDSKILSYSTGDVYDMIVADSFHLYDGGENAVMEELADLFQ